MAKRFSDSEKWNDVWFTELSNDHKIIWIYLLDNCDNAGIFKLNIKLINFNCSTNISVEEFISIFKERITQINKESWLINKFCIFQYGADFLTKPGNKAVQSAIKKLMEANVVELINNNYSISIPYSSPINTLSIEDKSPIDTPKDKDKDKDKNENKRMNKLEEWEKNIMIESIIKKIKKIDIQNILIKYINGEDLTQNQRIIVNHNKEYIISNIPKLNSII